MGCVYKGQLKSMSMIQETLNNGLKYRDFVKVMDFLFHVEQFHMKWYIVGYGTA